MSQIFVESSNDFDFAVAMRAAMDLESGIDHDALHPGWRERYVAFLRERQERGEAQFFIAHDEGDGRCGSAFVALSDHYRTHAYGTRYATVHGVYVKPEYRRRGIATMLMSAIETWARTHEYDVLRLRSSAMGEPLYRGLGFSATTELEKKLR